MRLDAGSHEPAVTPAPVPGSVGARPHFTAVSSSASESTEPSGAFPQEEDASWPWQPIRALLLESAHVFTLFHFAFVYHLLDLLARRPVFLVVRRLGSLEIVALTIFLCLGLPAALVSVELIAGCFNRRLREFSHSCIVFVLLTVIVLPCLRGIVVYPGVLPLGMALSLGLLGTVAYVRLQPVRLLVTVLSPVAVLVPLGFLTLSPLSALVWEQEAPLALDVRVANPVPVVVVVFDEFNGTSLMDEQRRIDSSRYPSFARLAARSIWYRNATTMAHSTVEAVPAILSGEYPDDTRLPHFAYYPNNLFTLLAKTYAMTAVEPVTDLNPYRQMSAKPSSAPSGAQACWQILGDLAMLELHILLADNGPVQLPPLAARWANFATTTGEECAAPPDRVFEDFLLNLRRSDRPGLFFAHVFLPHVPYCCLPSGKKYPAPPFPLPCLMSEENWVNDLQAVTRVHQQYLLQLADTDRLLGLLLDRLESIGLYDDCLLVVTADHGVSFRPGDNRRWLTETNYPDIMSIPLFVKLPGQTAGRISDRSVQTTDILPTIADVLGVNVPWELDGTSALDSSQPARPKRFNAASQVVFWEEVLPRGLDHLPYLGECFGEDGDPRRLRFDSAFEKRFDTLHEMLARFGSGKKTDGLYRFGPHADLVGRAVADLEVIPERSVTVTLDRTDAFDNVDLSSELLPACLSGTVIANPKIASAVALAISVNGVIRAVTTPYLAEPRLWTAMVPERAFRAGRNHVEVYAVSTVDGEPVLSPSLAAAGNERLLQGSTREPSGE